jgi:hypothetical protein
MVIHDAFETAVHEQPEGAVMFTGAPAPPAAVIEWLFGAITNEQLWPGGGGLGGGDGGGFGDVGGGDGGGVGDVGGGDGGVGGDVGGGDGGGPGGDGGG